MEARNVEILGRTRNTPHHIACSFFVRSGSTKLDSVERIAKKLRFLTTGLAKKEFSPLDAHMSHQELGLDLNNNYYKNLVDMSSDEGRPQSPSASGGD